MECVSHVLRAPPHLYTTLFKSYNKRLFVSSIRPPLSNFLQSVTVMHLLLFSTAFYGYCSSEPVNRMSLPSPAVPLYMTTLSHHYSACLTDTRGKQYLHSFVSFRFGTVCFPLLYPFYNLPSPGEYRDAWRTILIL